MELRDRFAVHFAAALTGALSDPEQIARHAYDLAEAMLAERALRVDADERRAIEVEPEREPLAAPPSEHHGALLDEAAPMLDEGPEEELDPRWLEDEAPYDPSWDREPRWSGERPGLARTQPPEASEPGKERSA